MDSLSPEQRSKNMSQIRSTSSSPEMLVRRLVFGMGYRYRLHNHKLPGRPDLVFSSRKKIILLNGCFWHQHDNCALAHIPKSRVDYWRPKLERNKKRDAENVARLERLGWNVLTIWECQTKNRPELRHVISEFLD